MLGNEASADDCDRKPAEPGDDFELRGLRREVAQQIKTNLLIGPDVVHKTAPPIGNRLEGVDIAEALDRLRDKGAQQPVPGARRGAEPVDAGAGHYRREGGIKDE